MAIDYVVHLTCTPKETFGADGILDRLKAGARAREVIRLYRENGDGRPPSEMGFEFTRSTPEGEEEIAVILVQDMLAQAAELEPLLPWCADCPANVLGRPFGCYGAINYPISSAAEKWLLDQLPSNQDAILWLLLRETLKENDGHAVGPLRAGGAYFEEKAIRGRQYPEAVASADQIFQMLFLYGHIQARHAGILLLFFHAVPRDSLEPTDITRLLDGTFPQGEMEERFPFRLAHDDGDDSSVAEFKTFFKALHRAWLLNVPLLLDV
jgi:hypothetical protein